MKLSYRSERVSDGHSVVAPVEIINDGPGEAQVRDMISYGGNVYYSGFFPAGNFDFLSFDAALIKWDGEVAVGRSLPGASHPGTLVWGGRRMRVLDLGDGPHLYIATPGRLNKIDLDTLDVIESWTRSGVHDFDAGVVDGEFRLYATDDQGVVWRPVVNGWIGGSATSTAVTGSLFHCEIFNGEVYYTRSGTITKYDGTSETAIASGQVNQAFLKVDDELWIAPSSLITTSPFSGLDPNYRILRWSGSEWLGGYIPTNSIATVVSRPFMLSTGEVVISGSMGDDSRIHVISADRLSVSGLAPVAVEGDDPQFPARFAEIDGLLIGGIWSKGSGQGPSINGFLSYSFTLGDLPLNLNFDVPILPTTLTPAHQQIRVFIEGEELPTSDWRYEDGRIRTDTLYPQSTEVVAFRETRFDKSWVQFTPASKLKRSSDAMNYYHQRLFLLQEFCEIEKIAEAIGFPIPHPPEVKDDSAYSILVTDGSVDLSLLEFLPESTAGPLYLQLEVLSLNGTHFKFGGDTPSSTEWGFDNGAVILPAGWGTSDWPIKVRRRTRKDQLWHRLTDASSFSSTQFRMIEKQLQFLLEESCGFPDLPPGHPLRNTIFPRQLNFLEYVGVQSFRFTNYPWTPDSGVTVWVNDLLLAESDYSIDWPSLTLTIPDLGPTDKVKVTTGGGIYAGTGLSMVGSPTGEADDNILASDIVPAEPAPIERWGVDAVGSIEPYVYLSAADTPAPGLIPVVGAPHMGLKYTAPGGQDIVIRVGRFARCNNDSHLPAGVERYRSYAQWESKNGGSSWSLSREISGCLTGILAPLPSWAVNLRVHYFNKGGTIAGLIQGLSSASYSTNGVPNNHYVAQLIPATTQAKASGLDQMTGDQFAAWLNGENPFEPQ